MLAPHFLNENESAYPGEFTPKRKILKAIAAGYFDSKNTTIEPKISIFDTDELYKVELSAPGIKRENLLVSINEAGHLCILGFKTSKKMTTDSHITKVKSRMETFLREIPLPDHVDPAFTSATCSEGTLSIIFTKSDRKIKKRPSTIVVY